MDRQPLGCIEPNELSLLLLLLLLLLILLTSSLNEWSNVMTTNHNDAGLIPDM